MSRARPRNRIFVSYSHRDRPWLDRLREKLLEAPDFDTQFFDDTELKTGDYWFERIQHEVDNSTTALLLASGSFFRSEFINEHELARFKALAETERAAARSGDDQFQGYRLIVLPIGAEGARQVKLKLADIQALCPVDQPFPEDPEDLDVDAVVAAIRRAIDPRKSFLEDRFAENHRAIRIIGLLDQGYGTHLYQAKEEFPPSRDLVVKVVGTGANAGEFADTLKQMDRLIGIPSVVPIHFTDLNTEYPYYVSRYVEGGSLRKYLQENHAQKWDVTQRIMLTLGRAIRSAREQGMQSYCVDLRPSHVLVESRGTTLEPFLNLSLRDINEQRGRLLKRLQGLRQEDRDEAIAYLLPEQLTCAGATPPPPASDMYLLGLLGYHLLEGRLPTAVDEAQLMAYLASDDVDATVEFPERTLLSPAHLTLEGEVEEWTDREYLKVVIERMITREPEDRFQRYEEALWALENPRLYALRSVRRAFVRCRASESFFKDFYNNFFTLCPDAKSLFAHLRSTDSKQWKRQRELVKKAISLLLGHFAQQAAPIIIHDTIEEEETVLAYFAERHTAMMKKRNDALHKKGQGVTVAPAWFDHFVDALAMTNPPPAADEDPRQQEVVRAMKRQLLRVGSAFLRRQHELTSSD